VKVRILSSAPMLTQINTYALILAKDLRMTTSTQ
jgi:hypothetical protein